EHGVRGVLVTGVQTCALPISVETITFTEGARDSFPSPSGLYTPARHSVRANLAFVDGHVSGVKSNDYRRTAAEDTSSNVEWSVRSEQRRVGGRWGGWEAGAGR